MKLAPIALFTYNRPQHTRQTLEALSSNDLADQSTLYIFCDGPKKGCESATLEKIREVRRLAKSKVWCDSVHVIERSENMGLAANIVEGVTHIVNEFGKVIVLEDDLVTSRYFLTFMNKALSHYEDLDLVGCISGYTYPVKETLPSSFFITGADCWGWATWKRAWSFYESDGTKLLKAIRETGQGFDFDFNGSYPYTKMLRDQTEGKNDSWAVRWYASLYLRGQLCLYPGRSLVQNIGMDGSGTHSPNTKTFDNDGFSDNFQFLPVNSVENQQARNSFVKYFRTLRPRRRILFSVLDLFIKNRR
ncbi:MAG: glycosyltransferase family A protein [Imperialibacter sp.]|uniref:glycosyltransferase family A protein n=1 Tax=Imperialibacter sp. TaxID=2038411 RepID=UPI0032EFCF2C